MKNIDFIKMHGLGNDFVIIDLRSQKIAISPDMAREVCDRNRGVGCDQLVTIESSGKGDCFVRFYNNDGSESSACGNATRCIAKLMIAETGREKVVIETKAGILECWQAENGLIAVNMGKFKNDWQSIPLSRESDTLAVDISEGGLKNPVAVNVGNPHAVFFIDNIQDFPLQNVGPKLEHNKIFPQRANIEIAQIISKKEINMRVWERGSGETMACGTGACAVGVAAYLKGFADSEVVVHLTGGDLKINIQKDHTVIMTGAAVEVFRGRIK